MKKRKIVKTRKTVKKRKIKAKVTLEIEQKLTKKEVAALKKAISGQIIKTVSTKGSKVDQVSIIQHLTHVHPVHTHPTVC